MKQSRIDKYRQSEELQLKEHAAQIRQFLSDSKQENEEEKELLSASS